MPFRRRFRPGYARRRLPGIRGRGGYSVARYNLRGRGGYFSDIGSLVGRGVEKLTGLGGYRRRVFKGRGSYWSKLAGAAIRGAAIGGTLGGYAGKSPAGASLIPAGALAGALIGGGSHILGMGDYQVTKNSLMVSEGNDPPHMANSAKYNIFRHREFLGNVTGSTSFSVTAYPLNPGMVQSFPWFSSIANNYVSYKPRGIVFEFKSTSADALNSTNTALGKVMMCTQYNVNQPAFVNSSQMLNYDKCTSGKPACSLLHPVECDPRQLPYREFNVRHGAIPSGQDARLYDMGTMYLATEGMQAAATIGELWISFEFELLTPTMVGGAGETVLTDSWKATTGITTSKYFGSSVTPSSTNSLGVTLAATTITFPSYIVQGEYIINYLVAGGSTAVTAPTFTATSGCSIVSGANNDIPGAGSTSTSVARILVVKITAASAVITLSAGTLPSSPTAMYLWITQWDADNAATYDGTAVSI